MKKRPVYIIAEAGVNHNGSRDLALKMVDKAKEAGADCIKFQTFHASEMTSEVAEKADYQKETTSQTESQLAMLEKLELTEADFIAIMEACKKKEIQFLSTPFDRTSIDFLEQMGMPFWKIPSGEITNLPYLERIAGTEKPVVLSTGMSTMSEIEEAIDVLRKYGCKEISLLHCTTEYPADLCDIHLRAMETMREYFKVPIGYSDHTRGIEVPIAAVALGAVILEKHFTLDRDMEGPDHQASLEPEELRAMITAVRHVELALGTPVKKVSDKEQVNRRAARKSIVASCPIAKGSLFTEENLAAKRPGGGISPMRWHEIIGTKAFRDYGKDEMI